VQISRIALKLKSAFPSWKGTFPFFTFDQVPPDQAPAHEMPAFTCAIFPYPMKKNFGLFIKVFSVISTLAPLLILAADIFTYAATKIKEHAAKNQFDPQTTVGV
jgi:hypothetical protein